ncbi:MAG: hypothetical protein HYS13_02460 [Planctomycetia bacterium]|nr:hypothetical protein [Planctomycetia bacterium]
MSAILSRRQGLWLGGGALVMAALPGAMLIWAAHQPRQDEPPPAQAADFVQGAAERPAVRQPVAQRAEPSLPVVERPVLVAPPASPPAPAAAPWRDGREIGTRILYCTEDPANCARIVRVLEEPTRLDCSAMPLSLVAEHWEKLHRISVEVDRTALAEAGIDPDAPVTARLGRVSLQAALHNVLDPLKLEAVIENGFLIIVPRDRARRMLSTVIYEADDLTPPSDRGGPDFSELTALIQAVVEPDSWRDARGGDGVIQPMLRTLVVTAEPVIHEQVRRLLRALRAARMQQATALGDTRYLPVSGDAGPGDAHVRTALAEPVDLALVEQPLKEVLDSLSRQLGVPIVADAQALDDAGISPAEPVTASFARVTAKAALTRLLRRMELAWTVRRGAVVVTSPRYCASLELRVYPVRDFADTDGAFEYEEMVKAVAGTVAAERGRAKPEVKEFRLGGCLVVAHDDEGHQRVERLLSALRRAMAGREPLLRKAELVLGVYHLPPAVAGKPQPTCQELKELVMNLVEPESWQGRGGQGTIYVMTGSLVVRNSPKAQMASAALLKQFGVEPRRDAPALTGGLSGNNVNNGFCCGGFF